MNADALHLKIDIDRTSAYIVITDLKNRGLYVLQVIKETYTESLDSSLKLESPENKKINFDKTQNNMIENSNGESDDVPSINSTNEDEKVKSIAYIKSIAEFPLSHPILSFVIIDGAVRKSKCSYFLNEVDDYDIENDSVYGVVVCMYAVIPDSVQHFRILYQPSVNESVEVASTMSEDNNNYMSDAIMELSTRSDKSSQDIADNKNINVKKIVSNTDNIPIGETSPKINKLKSPLSYVTSDNNNPVNQKSIVSPQIIAKPNNQVNLMTPNAFNSNSTGNCISVF